MYSFRECRLNTSWPACVRARRAASDLLGASDLQGEQLRVGTRCTHVKMGYKKCEHGRVRSVCKECGGGSICEHGRRRYTCKECGGGSICEHGRHRSQCKDCGGSGICEHGRVRHCCKECGGSGICEHGRVRSICKECGGGSIWVVPRLVRS